MIVVYYFDCAPIFFLLFVYYLEYHSSLLRSLPVTPESPELPFPSLWLSCSAGSPITLMRYGVLLNYRRSRPITYGAFAPFV